MAINLFPLPGIVLSLDNTDQCSIFMMSLKSGNICESSICLLAWLCCRLGLNSAVLKLGTFIVDEDCEAGDRIFHLMAA